ncbi:MAG: DUF4340 domain-containing protein [Bacteroidetes bacterium]|nr:DUF4340 domain-containing protein [Bacteroidota bacterium]
MKKINNKILLAVFLILAILAIIMIVVDNRKGERSFREELFRIDSAAVTNITIHPKGMKSETIDLIKTGRTWEVKAGNRSYPADTMTVQRILQSLARVKAERVAATGRDGWKGLEMTDSLSTRVVVSQGKDVTADFRVGKISFNRNAMSGYGGNQNVDVKSHIRVADDEKVYVVDGYLSMMFRDQPSAYRNRMVFRFNKADLAKLTFVYPGDSSFQLVKSGSRWLVNDKPADSAKVENWLNSIANCTSSDFADEKMQPVVFPFTCRIEGNNMKTIEVKGACEESSKSYFIISTFNTSATFGGPNAYLFNQLFPGKLKFAVTKDAPKKGKKK